MLVAARFDFKVRSGAFCAASASFALRAMSAVLNFGRLADRRLSPSSNASSVALELGDAEERLSLVAQKIEAVRVLGERGLASRQTGLIFRQSLRMLLDVAVLVDVADFHMRVDDVGVALSSRLDEAIFAATPTASSYS